MSPRFAGILAATKGYEASNTLIWQPIRRGDSARAEAAGRGASNGSAFNMPSIQRSSGCRCSKTTNPPEYRLVRDSGMTSGRQRSSHGATYVHNGEKP